MAALLAGLLDDVALAGRAGLPLTEALEKLPGPLWTSVLREMVVVLGDVALVDGGQDAVIVAGKKTSEDVGTAPALLQLVRTAEAVQVVAQRPQGRLVASLALRKRAMGVDKGTHYELTDMYLLVLENIARMRGDGVSQEELGKRVNKKPKDLFFLLKNLDRVRVNMQGQRAIMIFLPRFLNDAGIVSMDGGEGGASNFGDLFSSKVPADLFKQRMCVTVEAAPHKTMRQTDLFDKMFSAKELEDNRKRNMKVLSSCIELLQEKGFLERFIVMSKDNRKNVCVRSLQPYSKNQDDDDDEDQVQTSPLSAEASNLSHLYQTMLNAGTDGATSKFLESTTGYDYKRMTNMIEMMRKQDIIKADDVESKGRQRFYRYVATKALADAAPIKAEAAGSSASSAEQQPDQVRIVAAHVPVAVPTPVKKPRKRKATDADDVGEEGGVQDVPILAAAAAAAAADPLQTPEQRQREKYYKSFSLTQKARAECVTSLLKEAGGAMLITYVTLANQLTKAEANGQTIDKKTVMNLITAMENRREIGRVTFHTEDQKFSRHILMLPHITADDPIVTALRNDKVAIESINTPFKRIKVRQVGEDIQEHIENLVQNDVTSGVMRKRTPAMMNKRSKPDVLGGVVKYFGWEPYPTRLAEQSTQLKLCLNSFFSSRSTRVRNMHEHLARFCNSSTIENGAKIPFNPIEALMAMPLRLFFQVVSIKHNLPAELADMFSKDDVPDVRVCDLPMPLQVYAAVQASLDNDNTVSLFAWLYQMSIIQPDTTRFAPDPANLTELLTSPTCSKGDLEEFLSATLPLPLAADLNTRLYAIDFQCEFLASPILVADADRFAGMSKELEKVPERLREPQIVNVAQEEGRIMFWAKLWISKTLLMNMPKAAHAQKHFAVLKQKALGDGQVKVPAVLSIKQPSTEPQTPEPLRTHQLPIQHAPRGKKRVRTDSTEGGNTYEAQITLRDIVESENQNWHGLQRDWFIPKIRNAVTATTRAMSIPWTFSTVVLGSNMEPTGLARSAHDAYAKSATASTQMETLLSVVCATIALLYNHDQKINVKEVSASLELASSTLYTKALELLVGESHRLVEKLKDVVVPGVEIETDIVMGVVPLDNIQKFAIVHHKFADLLSLNDVVVDDNFMRTATNLWTAMKFNSAKPTDLLHHTFRGPDFAALMHGVASKTVKVEFEQLASPIGKESTMRHKHNMVAEFQLRAQVVPDAQPEPAPADNDEENDDAMDEDVTPRSLLLKHAKARGDKLPSAAADRGNTVFGVLKATFPNGASFVSLQKHLAENMHQHDIGREIADLVTLGLVVRDGYVSSRLIVASAYKGFTVPSSASVIFAQPPRRWKNIVTGEIIPAVLKTYLLPIFQAIFNFQGVTFDNLYARYAGILTRPELEDLLDLLISHGAIKASASFILASRKCVASSAQDYAPLLHTHPSSDQDSLVRSYTVPSNFFATVDSLF